jgi:PPM family protein phosphatase
MEWQEVRAPKLHVREDWLKPQYFSFLDYQLVAFCSKNPSAERPNEDSILILPFGKEKGLLAIADGAGGTREGGRASQMALEILCDSVLKAEKEGQESRVGVLNGVERANEEVMKLGSGSGTTLVVVELQTQARSGQVRSYHVGDSEAVVVGQRGRVKLQTVSHTPSGYGLEAGLLSESEALSHEERHLLLNLIGSSAMRIEMGPSVEMAPRDTLLMGSDGLFDNWRMDELLAETKKGPLPEIAEQLILKTQKRMHEPLKDQPHKADDLTFFLMRKAFKADSSPQNKT